MNTEYKYREIMADNTIAEDRDDSSFIWDNQYEEEERINIYDLSIFVREEGDLFRKYHETHYQRAYTLEDMKRAIAGGRNGICCCLRRVHEESAAGGQ